jgi:hypothetical protein
MQAAQDAENAAMLAQLAANQLPPVPPTDVQAAPPWVVAMMQQQQQQIQQQQQMLLQLMTQQQMQLQQPNQAAQMLTLSSLGQLNRFHGRSDASGMVAREWVAHAELHFSAREHALQMPGGQADAHRVMAACGAMQDDALRWWSALQTPPSTWAALREALLRRFASIPAAQVQEASLHRFIEASKKTRDRLNVEGIQRYTTLFLQYAGLIPDSRMTDATKRSLYAKGLPPYHAEFVLKDDAKEQAMPLHELAQKVVSRATLKEYASSTSSSSSAHTAHGDAMQVDAISLAAMQFGVSREEAASYLEPAEGWSIHDTDQPQGPPRHKAGPPASSEEAFMEKILAAVGTRFGNSHAGGSSSSGLSRRTVPADVKKQVPEPLAKERSAAGLCIKCGIVPYGQGKNGHNSRTCKAAPDLTTSAKDGKRRAGLPDFP